MQICDYNTNELLSADEMKRYSILRNFYNQEEKDIIWNTKTLENLEALGVTDTMPSNAKDLDFSKFCFSERPFNGAIFENCDFSECDFTKSFLQGSTFINCNFTGAIFPLTQLSRTEFKDCDFTKTTLVYANNVPKDIEKNNKNVGLTVAQQIEDGVGICFDFCDFIEKKYFLDVYSKGLKAMEEEELYDNTEVRLEMLSVLIQMRVNEETMKRFEEMGVDYINRDLSGFARDYAIDMLKTGFGDYNLIPILREDREELKPFPFSSSRVPVELMFVSKAEEGVEIPDSVIESVEYDFSGKADYSERLKNKLFFKTEKVSDSFKKDENYLIYDYFKEEIQILPKEVGQKIEKELKNIKELENKIEEPKKKGNNNKNRPSL